MLARLHRVLARRLAYSHRVLVHKGPCLQAERVSFASRYTYIDNNAGFIPNYGERYRYGERISTCFVESTVNQAISKRFCKRQQMQWTRGAHLLLQTWVKTLNRELGAVFRRWSPDLQLEEEPLAA